MNKFCNKMKYFEETEKVPAETYYHYTSVDALYNIIKSKSFRLTSLKSSNDKKELFYKPKDFVDDLKRCIDEDNDINIKEKYTSIIESIESNENKYLEICKENGLPYALCLSQKRDNLTHWDRYANGCTGVCIAFNVSALRIHMQRLNTRLFGIGIFDIGPVLYSKDLKDAYIKSKIMKIETAFEKSTSDDNIEAINWYKKNGYQYAANIYRLTKSFVKNSSFIDEDEIRLFHDSKSIRDTRHVIDLIKDDIDDGLYKNQVHNFEQFVDDLQIERENFYLGANGIRGFKNLCLEEVWGNGTIPEIVLGPMCTQNKQELIRFLRANGLEGTKVRYSDVPIR